MNTNNNSESYSVLYRATLGIVIHKETTISVKTSDIVSILMINNYDNASYPIIRIRLYSDLQMIQQLTEYPNDISIRCNLDGGIYKMNTDESSPVMCSAVKSLSFKLKGYLENKNTPTSFVDSYENGALKKTDLNVNNKVPIELYCYDDHTVHMMKQRVQSIYNNASVLSVITNMFDRNSLYSYKIDDFANQEKYDQILIPNMSVIQALSYIDIKYGLYKKGAQLYCDLNNIYICDTDVNNGQTPYPIYVMSSKNNNDMTGVIKYNTKYYMVTMARNISVISETDIERALNSENIAAINLNDLKLTSTSMDKLYSKINRTDTDIMITTPNILHKSLNQGISDTYVARINEKITQIDISGVGFDIEKMKVNTRYNLIFESPMRGMSMNDFYRASNVTHVLTNLNADLFCAQTTMSLCSN